MCFLFPARFKTVDEKGQHANQICFQRSTDIHTSNRWSVPPIIDNQIPYDNSLLSLRKHINFPGIGNIEKATYSCEEKTSCK